MDEEPQVETVGGLETVVTDTKILIERLTAREVRLQTALQSLDTLSDNLAQLGQTLLNRVNVIVSAGQTLNSKIQNLSDKIDAVADDSVEMKTRLETIESNIESVRQTVAALLDVAGPPESTTTTTPPPPQE